MTVLYPNCVIMRCYNSNFKYKQNDRKVEVFLFFFVICIV